MQEPEKWTFLSWAGNDAVLIHVPEDYDPYAVRYVQRSSQPFFGIVEAAHGPYHEPTEEELARSGVLQTARIKSENKEDIKSELRKVSNSVDNPTHWNRLSPEIKSQMQTHYRELLRLRDHATFDGSGRIDEHIQVATKFRRLLASSGTLRLLIVVL